MYCQSSLTYNFNNDYCLNRDNAIFFAKMRYIHWPITLTYCGYVGIQLKWPQSLIATKELTLYVQSVLQSDFSGVKYSLVK